MAAIASRLKTGWPTTPTAPDTHSRVDGPHVESAPAPLTGARLTELTYYRGRVALSAILNALGISAGDEVVIQAFTCLAVPEGVMASGATPVYADIQANGFNVDADDLRRRITPLTRAIVVQHTFGIPAELDRILAVAGEAGVPVIEDCCHALGGRFHDQPLGSFGVASFYSFEWGKPIVAGLGGCAIANDPTLHERLQAAHREYRLPSLGRQIQLELQYLAFGLLYRPRWYWQVRTAFHRLASLGAVAGNFHPTQPSHVSSDFQMRMSPQMVRRVRRKARALEEVCRHSDDLVRQYRASIDAPSVTHPTPPTGSNPSYARYPLCVENKPDLLAEARRRKVEVADWYRSVIHPLEQDELRGVHYEPGSCPQAERRADEVVSLPTHRKVDRNYVTRAAELLITRS